MLVQVVGVVLVWLNYSATPYELAVRVLLPVGLICLVAALWFHSMARMDGERRLAEERDRHHQERERLLTQLERARADVLAKASSDKAQYMEEAHAEREKLVKDTHNQILRQERKVSRQANVKIGMAFMAVTALGVLMLITELLTLGLITIMTAGGAMGGYLLRWRQTRRLMDRVTEVSAPPETPALPDLSKKELRSPVEVSGTTNVLSRKKNSQASTLP